MADRTCKQCGKQFRVAAELRRHEARKTPCALIVEAEEGPAPSKENKTCRFCGRVFSAYDSMRRHVRENCKIAPNKKNGDAGLEHLYDHTVQKKLAEQKAEITEMRTQNADQSAKIDRLEAMMKQLLQQGATTASSTLQAGELAIQAGDHAQVDNSKKIVNINVFGQEKLDHVTAERIKAILDECLQRPALPAAVGEAVLKTAMLVYSDPDRPENLTAYLPNKKTKDALVHTKAGWEVQPTQLVLPPMALKSIDTIFGRQPHSDEYAPLLKELQQNEARFAAGEDLQPILVRNKDLLAQVLATLPVAGK